MKFPQPPSALEETFAIQVRHERLPQPLREYKFDQTRGWRADFAWAAEKLLVEIEGHGHQHDNRYKTDLEKYNAASVLGWCLLRFDRAAVMDLKGILGERYRYRNYD